MLLSVSHYFQALIVRQCMSNSAGKRVCVSSMLSLGSICVSDGQTEIRKATRMTLTVAITVHPAGVLVCFVILMTGRANGKGASRKDAMMVCRRPKATRGKKSTPSILARSQTIFCAITSYTYRFVLNLCSNAR